MALAETARSEPQVSTPNKLIKQLKEGEINLDEYVALDFSATLCTAIDKIKSAEALAKRNCGERKTA